MGSRRPQGTMVLGALLALVAAGAAGALAPPTLSPASGTFDNLLVVTLSAPPVGASNLVSFDAGATWSAAGTNLLLDGYGQGSASILAESRSGASQSPTAAYGPFQFVVDPTGVAANWQPDHSSVAVTLTNATTNALAAWQIAGVGINSNAAFTANSPRNVTLYGFKHGYQSSTNVWVLRQESPAHDKPQ